MKVFRFTMVVHAVYCTFLAAHIVIDSMKEQRGLNTEELLELHDTDSTFLIRIITREKTLVYNY